MLLIWLLPLLQCCSLTTREQKKMMSEFWLPPHSPSQIYSPKFCSILSIFKDVMVDLDSKLVANLAASLAPSPAPEKRTQKTKIMSEFKTPCSISS